MFLPLWGTSRGAWSEETRRWGENSWVGLWLILEAGLGISVPFHFSVSLTLALKYAATRVGLLWSKKQLGDLGFTHYDSFFSRSVWHSSQSSWTLGVRSGVTAPKVTVRLTSCDCHDKEFHLVSAVLVSCVILVWKSLTWHHDKLQLFS